MNPFIQAHWPVPNWIKAVTTTRQKDYANTQQDNRQWLKHHFGFSQDLPWLTQTHSNQVTYIDNSIKFPLEADASWTDQTNQACVVLTGDCLPLLLCNRSGTVVGAVHAGWRGLLNGIIENTVIEMRTKTSEPLLAWMGPSIGPRCFEVGPDVVEPFIEADPYSRGAFLPHTVPGKWLANLYGLAKSRLNQLGITQIYGGEYCTYTEQDKFFSNRKTKTPSRMATLIWISKTL